MSSGDRPTSSAAAKRKQAAGLTLVAAVVLGSFAYILLAKPFVGSSSAGADAGGGPVEVASARSRPFPVATLAPVGTAGQDPGGGGGEVGRARPQPVPEVLGSLLPQNPPAYQALGPILFLSGVNLIEPNRSAVYSGEVTVDSSGSGFQSDGSLTGCGRPGTADYYAIPLRNQVTYSGPPRVHLRFDGGGPVVVTLFEQHADGSCIVVASGSGTPGHGTLDLTLSGTGHTFAVGVLPGVLISGSGVLRTDATDPSYGLLPGLTGV